MLAGKGFHQVFNLTGGIKAWHRALAVGPAESGLPLFSDATTPKEAIITGFGLEGGLHDFYLSMQARANTNATKALFALLAEIETKHQNRLLSLYREITGTDLTLADFAQHIVQPAMEGGLSTEAYLNLYHPDLDAEPEVLGLALAIEAQALDLYVRAAQQQKTDERCRQVLLQIAEEERHHIAKLSQHLDQLLEG